MNLPVPEFSRIVSVSRIPPKGLEETLEAKPAEREALAKRFGLMDLPVLKANLTLTPGSQNTITATGTLEAEVVQSCILTLEPLHNRLDVKIDLIFLPSDAVEVGGRPLKDAELEDEFEFYTNGKIDIGEVVAQQLGINIDPYPRKKNAELPQTEFGKKPEKPRPFAQLAAAVKSRKNKAKS